MYLHVCSDTLDSVYSVAASATSRNSLTIASDFQPTVLSGSAKHVPPCVTIWGQRRPRRPSARQQAGAARGLGRTAVVAAPCARRAAAATEGAGGASRYADRICACESVRAFARSSTSGKPHAKSAPTRKRVSSRRSRPGPAREMARIGPSEGRRWPITCRKRSPEDSVVTAPVRCAALVSCVHACTIGWADRGFRA
eukprot:scaffold1009_cov375-Prasinococcus_capsulatus_cf.AAC.13